MKTCLRIPQEGERNDAESAALACRARGLLLEEIARAAAEEEGGMDDHHPVDSYYVKARSKARQL